MQWFLLAWCHFCVKSRSFAPLPITWNSTECDAVCCVKTEECIESIKNLRVKFHVGWSDELIWLRVESAAHFSFNASDAPRSILIPRLSICEREKRWTRRFKLIASERPDLIFLYSQRASARWTDAPSSLVPHFSLSGRSRFIYFNGVGERKMCSPISMPCSTWNQHYAINKKLVFQMACTCSRMPNPSFAFSNLIHI